MLACTFPAACFIRAQGTVAHHHASAAIIDGAIQPDAIPDLTAYRLYLIAISRPPNTSQQETRHQAAQLAQISLRDQDNKLLIGILAAFNSQYLAWIKDFNEHAKAAWAQGEEFDSAPLLAERDLLVQTTHDSLRSALSPDGWSHFDGFVKSEKKRMRISVKEAAQ